MICQNLSHPIAMFSQSLKASSAQTVPISPRCPSSGALGTETPYGFPTCAVLISLPPMPPGSLHYEGNELGIYRYNGALAFYNLDKVKKLIIVEVSHISLTDLRMLNSLRNLLRSPENWMTLLSSVEFKSSVSRGFVLPENRCQRYSIVSQLFPN